MRHVGGHIRTLACAVSLCALGACSNALRSSAGTAETCAFSESPRVPSAHSASDTATILFRIADIRASSAERGACAVRLVAVALRPWPTRSHDRWTVEITHTDTSATAHRLGTARARDVVDAGVAVMATEDRDLIAYAAARPGLEVTPLPWDRTYFRLARGATPPLGVEHPTDAVRVDARDAEAVTCDTVLHSPASASATTSRVVYEAGDRTARELAERVVAIAGGRTTAAALEPAELDAALRGGDDLAYIVSVPRVASDGCNALAALAQRAPWLAPHSALPLIDTRVHVIAPRPSQP